MSKLLEKVLNTVYNHHTYHNWYSYGNVEEHDSYVSFEVYGHNDQGEGADWIEYWSVDNEGKIYTEDTTYNDYEEFLREWV